MITILGIIGALGGSGLIAALVLALRGWRKEQGSQDEAFKKVLETRSENEQLKLELAQIVASRDILAESCRGLNERTSRLTTQLQFVEGQRDELLKELAKVDPNGNAIADGINRELLALKAMSTKGSGNGNR